jgi:hypothetical protein
MSAKPSSIVDPQRHLLRHSVATLAYRGGKVLRGAPPGFAEFRISETSRTPGQILAHIGDLLDWCLSTVRGKQEWHNSAPVAWEQGTERFFAALAALDRQLASGEDLAVPAERLFQGPIADAFTHIGQIAMLRRVAGAPVRGENYMEASIAAGRVGAEQMPPGYEFE